MTRPYTDREICELVRRHAAAQDVRLTAFLAPITYYGASAIASVERGKRFSAERRAKLIALIEAQPPIDLSAPAPQRKIYRERTQPPVPMKRPDYAHINPATGRTASEDERLRLEQLMEQRVDRTPCPRCAVRADVGCVHSRRMAA